MVGSVTRTEKGKKPRPNREGGWGLEVFTREMRQREGAHRSIWMSKLSSQTTEETDLDLRNQRTEEGLKPSV